MTAASAPVPSPVIAVAATPVECLLEWARLKPQQAALVGFEQRVTYGELANEVRLAAAWLSGQGVHAGDTLAISLDAEPALLLHQLALCWGAALAGAALLPLYAGVTEIRAQTLLQHFEAGWWLASHAGGSAPEAEHVTRPPKPLNMADYATARRTGFASPKSVEFQPNPTAPFVYDYTSGTTGTPRLVLHSHGLYLAAVVAHGANQRWQGGDVFLPPSLWPGKVGLRGMFRALSLGLTVVIEPFPETLAAFDALIAALDITCAAASPVQLRLLMTSPQATSKEGHRLKVINVTGAYFAPEEIRQGRRQVSPNLRFGYGAAEVGAIASLAPEDKPDGKFTLVPTMQVQALDARGQVLGPGLEGRLRIRAPWVCTGYARNPEATAECFKDGWFYSTDTGYIDTEGRLCLQGRTDDAINLGGIKIYPRDVEAALLAHPDVQDAAVIGYPEPLLGDVPVAFVQFRRPVSMPALRAWLSGRLYNWQMPRGLVVMQTLPRTPDGKLIKAQMQEIYGKMGERKA